jgi:hypothetical protein
MEGCRAGGHLTDPRNKWREETSRRQRKREASSERGQGLEGAVGPYMEWNGMEWNGMEWNGMEWNGRSVCNFLG